MTPNICKTERLPRSGFILLIALLFTVGCSAMQRVAAKQSAEVAREIADESALTWRDLVAQRADYCRAKVPVADSTQAQREDCMGLFNETDKALKVFEGIVAAQKAVYWALKFGEMGDVRRALGSLDAVLEDAKPFLEAVQYHRKR